MDVPDEGRPRAQSMSNLSKPVTVRVSKEPLGLSSCRSEADMLSSSLPIPSFLDYFRVPSKTSSLAGSTESGFMSDEEGISFHCDQDIKDSFKGFTIAVPQIMVSSKDSLQQKKPGLEESAAKKSMFPTSLMDYFKKNSDSTTGGVKTVAAKVGEPSVNRTVRVNRRDLNSFAPTTL